MAKKKSKHYPVVRTSALANSTGVPQLNRVVLVDRMLSKLNRRLYRQGRNYKVKIDIDTTQAQTIEVFALRDDWAVQKAYQMAYQQYLDNTMDEREAMASNAIARWEDFKVDDGLGGDIVDPVLHDINGTAVVLTSGEFELSNVVDQANTRRSFTWGTPAANQYGILQEYDKAANTQSTPADVTGVDGPYSDIESDINTLTSADLGADGNNPPYNRNSINATEPLVKIAELSSSSSGVQKLSTGYFMAPCGIIFITNVGAATNDAKISFEVASGDYKGVHAPSMIEVATVNRKRKVVK